MPYVNRKALAAMVLAATAMAAAPASAERGPDRHGDHGRGHAYGHDDRGRHDRGHYDRGHDDRGRRGHDRVVIVQHRAPVRVVHRYDWNRPDPRYHGYYANRYYRSGYAPIRVTRETRIYRGSDNRYYCRRSDGTTGLIIGAALGGVIGDRLDNGRSSILGAVLGASAGGLLGRDLDRGNLVCR